MQRLTIERYLIYGLCAWVFIFSLKTFYFTSPSPPPVKLDGTRKEFLKDNLERYHDQRNGGMSHDAASEAFIQNTSPIFNLDDEPQAKAETVEEKPLSDAERKSLYAWLEITPPPEYEPSEPVPSTCKNCIEAQREPTQKPVARAPPRRVVFRRW